jgi:predicted nucleotidyltransferase
VPVDLIPFGPIASADGEVAWPPSRDVVLYVAGFEDALQSSVRIEIYGDLIVRVASLPGLTMLKLFAWGDRGRENSKDASDLYTLLSTYADAGNFDRLYEDEADLLETVEFDVVLAGAHLLGRDVARSCDARSLRRLGEIAGRADLISQMNRVCDLVEEHPERAHILVDHFRRGMAETRVT